MHLLVLFFSCAFWFLSLAIGSTRGDVRDSKIVHTHLGSINCSYTKKDNVDLRGHKKFEIEAPKPEDYGGCLLLCDLIKICHVTEYRKIKTSKHGVCYGFYQTSEADPTALPENYVLGPRKDYYFDVTCALWVPDTTTTKAPTSITYTLSPPETSTTTQTPTPTSATSSTNTPEATPLSTSSGTTSGTTTSVTAGTTASTRTTSTGSPESTTSSGTTSSGTPESTSSIGTSSATTTTVTPKTPPYETNTCMKCEHINITDQRIKAEKAGSYGKLEIKYRNISLLECELRFMYAHWHKDGFIKYWKDKWPGLRTECGIYSKVSSESKEKPDHPEGDLTTEETAFDIRYYKVAKCFEVPRESSS